MFINSHTVWKKKLVHLVYGLQTIICKPNIPLLSTKPGNTSLGLGNEMRSGFFGFSYGSDLCRNPIKHDINVYL